MNILKWDKRPITRPGIYSDIPNAAYHGQLTKGVSVSKTGLGKLFDESPAHYYQESYLNPESWERVMVDDVEVLRLKEKPASEALTFGRGAHHLLLGEKDFREHFIIRPETYIHPKEGKKPWSGNATVCKEWLAAQKEVNRTVLTQTELDHIKGMANTLGREPMIRAGILGGLIEHSMIWQDDETGVWLKSRPDAIPTGDLDFADLKTAADVTDDGIQKAIGDNNLHMQGALVAMACRELLGVEMTSFTLVFSEKKPPYCSRIHELTGEDLDLGEQQVRAALRLFARCVERKRWPGPGGDQTDAKYATMTPWRRKAIQRQITIIEAELSL